MVSEENTDVDLSALSGTPTPPEETGTPAPTGKTGTPTPPEEISPSPSGEKSPTPTPEKLPELTPSVSPEKNAGSTPTMPSMPTMPDSPTMPDMPTLPPESLLQETETKGEKISITVPLGMGSESLALELQKAGLVEDAMDFDHYLMQNNYALSIRPGTYRILPGATYEEIAKQVTAN